MNIIDIKMSVFTSENEFKYENNDLMALLKIFEGKQIIPGYFIEVGSKKSINRPFIKNIDDNTIITIGSSRIDIKFDNLDKEIKKEYNDKYFIEFMELNISYFNKLIEDFSLQINRIALNIEIKPHNIFQIINYIDFYKDNQQYNAMQIKVHRFDNFNHDINVVSDLISNKDNINLKLDINTSYNPKNKFSYNDLTTFFKDGFNLANELINQFTTNNK